MSICRANLPDPVEATLSQGSRSRKSSPNEDKPTHEGGKIEETTVVHSDSVQGAVVTRSVFTPGDVPLDLSPTTLRHPSHSPSQYINQDLPIHPSYDPSASSSTSQQDLKRKRLRVDADPPTTTSPQTLAYYPPVFVGSQPFIPQTFDELQSFPPPMIPTTAPPGGEQYGEHMGSYAFPYYFDN